MFPLEAMSNSTSISKEANISSEAMSNSHPSQKKPTSSHQNQQNKKKRSQPGNPDPEAEVVALSPNTLIMTANRFVCEICNKGFQRDQNLQLHMRGHNLPWKLRQRSGKEAARKRVYVCPERTCIHHHPLRALGDLTGIKKHFCRKHGEKKWKCEKCFKKYAVQSDCKAHVKSCGSREYRCDCGTIFSRKDSFITHRSFCDALAEESARLISSNFTLANTNLPPSTTWNTSSNPNPNSTLNSNILPLEFHMKPNEPVHPLHPYSLNQHLLYPATTTTTVISTSSATTLLQRASSMGILPPTTSTVTTADFNAVGLSMYQSGGNRLTRDFLGVVSSDVAAGEDEFHPISGLVVDLDTSPPFSHGDDHTKTLPGDWGG